MPEFIERELKAGMRAESGLPPQNERPERDDATQPPPASAPTLPLPETTPEAELLPLPEVWHEDTEEGAHEGSGSDMSIDEELSRVISVTGKPNRMSGEFGFVRGVYLCYWNCIDSLDEKLERSA
jgi:hypothetical protein